ncbi:MAG: GT2 family glycosyltransferase [Paracoccaceae bacterium]|jgi:GT2 family glycosyltransferase
MSLTVSIVIVSRHRPDALRRCLIGVSQLRYDPFEVVVVADPESCKALRMMPQATDVRVVPFDQANISAARNLGIGAAAGDIIAFIDDDAVPEPNWLHFLIAPFADPDVAAAGGFVRARNGISWQNRAQSVDQTGLQAPIELDPDRATVLTPAKGRAIKTEGTNMAVRRSVLAEMGGFDPRFRFFLDETDLNLRLAERGLCTAIAPRAEVHHGFAASSRRRADRTPTDLTEIGASWAVFLAKHCAPDLRDTAWARVKDEQRTRVLTHMVGGTLEPRDVRRLMRGLVDGYREGGERQAVPMPVLAHHPQSFRRWPRRQNARSVVLSGRVWARNRLRREAGQQTDAGMVVTVIRLSPTALFHRVSFAQGGYWEHTGGLFGRSERTQNLFSFWSFPRRVQAETARIDTVRGNLPGDVRKNRTSQNPGRLS